MSLLGAIAIGGGLLSGLSGRKAAQQQEDAMRDAQGNLASVKPYIDDYSQLGQDIYDMGFDRFKQYEEMFQPLEQSLHDYYMGLDPDTYAAQGTQTAQQQYQNAMKQVNDSLAARGLSSSGVGGQMNYDLSNQMAQNKANAIVNAPQQVAQMQQGWMNYGNQQGNNNWNRMMQGSDMQGNATNMYQNLGNAQAGVNQNAAGMYGQQAQQGYSGMGSLLGTGLYMGDKSGWFGKPGSLFGGR